MASQAFAVNVLCLLVLNCWINPLQAQSPGDTCYSILKRGSCPSNGRLINPGGSACTINDHCSGNRLCCFSNTGSKYCSDPEPQNPGTCPKTLINQGVGNCFVDSDCGLIQKCCRETACSYRCSDLAPAPPPTVVLPEFG